MHFPDLYLSTPRLILRPHTLADAGHIMELNNDPEVLRFTGDHAFGSEAEAVSLINLLHEQYLRYGMGRLVAEKKDSGEFVGWCGLKYHPENGEVDLGYRFLRKYWNLGYATECSQVMLAWGFEKKKLEKIIGRVGPDNVDSINVLEKIGMVFDREDVDEACHRVLIYYMTDHMWDRLKMYNHL